MQNTGLLRRLGAILYDLLLLFALLMLATVPFLVATGGEAVEPSNILYQLTMGIVIYGFFAGYWVKRGRTLGMQSWGLQLVNENNELATLAQSTLRFFAAILSWAALGLGFLWQLWDKDRLTWHDRLSGTRIVHIPRPKNEKRGKEKAASA